MKATFYTVAEKTIPMVPFAKERPRVTKNGTFMTNEYKANRDELAWRFGRVDAPALVRLTVVAIRPLPKRISKKKRGELLGTYATPSPDIDNIIGAVMDSLFSQDNLVVETAGRKIWGEEPALHIKIEGISYE